MATKYKNGFRYGQLVVCTQEDGPVMRGFWYPRKGTIGTIVNYDPSDESFSIEWRGGFEPHGMPDKQIYAWTKCEYVAPYKPEPRRSADGKRICDLCGEIVDDDSEMVYLEGHGWVCENCIEDKLVKCKVCGEYHIHDEVVLVDLHTSLTPFEHEEAYVCADCLETNPNFYHCAECGRWFDEFVVPYTATYNGFVCDSCIEMYAECPECGEFVRKDDLMLVPGRDYPICSKCRINLRKNAIRNYSYKPNPKFKIGGSHEQFNTDKDIKEILMGVELEVDKGENGLDCANEIISECEDVYCKHDSSLSCGIEIVSHPATLSYHLNDLGWDRIVEICRKYKFKSHEAKTCGLHVHIGRRQLGNNDTERDNTAGKLVLLMNRHWDNMVKFSRRLSSQLNWCECNKPEFDCAYTEDDLISRALETEDDGRYQAVNLCNEKTVEIRLFRGTLELNTIKATLEMVSNMCEYCKEHTALEVMNSQWADVAHFKEYTELYDYLQDRGIGDTQMSMLGTLPEWNFPKDPERLTEVIADTLLDCDRPQVPNDTLYRDSNIRSTHSFRIGEYVLVTNRDMGYDPNAPIGSIGRVVTYHSDALGIRFNNHDGPFHSLHGLLSDASGYFIRPYHLVHYYGPHSDIVMPEEPEFAF